MSTIRISHKKNYTCIANKAIRDKKLSFKARGIHHLLLSYPDDWVVNTAHLINESDFDGRDAVRSGLRELERAGYLVRNQLRNRKGQFANATYTIYESPHAENPEADCRCRETVAGFSDPILNTEIRSNDSNEILKDEVTFFETEKISNSVPDKSEEESNQKCGMHRRVPAGTEFQQGRRVIPQNQQALSIPCPETETIPEDKISPARNTSITRKTTDKFFGQGRSGLAVNKEKAIAAKIKLGEFESQEEAAEFALLAVAQIQQDSPKLSAFQAQEKAMWITKRLRGEGNMQPEIFDLAYLKLFRAGQLGNVSFEGVKQHQAREREIEKLKQWSVTGD
jgi:hypothetical protein